MKKMTGYHLFCNLAEILSPFIEMGSSGTRCVSSLENSRLHAIHCLSQAAGLLKHLRRNFTQSENDQVIHNEITHSAIENISIIFTYFGCNKDLLANGISASADVSNMQMLNVKFSSYLSRFNSLFFSSINILKHQSSL